MVKKEILLQNLLDTSNIQSTNYEKLKYARSFVYSFGGQTLTFDINSLAKKSNFSVLCRYGNTTVLTTLTIKKLVNEIDFFALTVSLEERFYAVGLIPNIYGKREGKTSIDGITVCRWIDRSLRAFLPLSSAHEVQVTNLVLSIDNLCDPRVVAAWNSFLVCYLSSELPYFNTPFATVILGKKEGELKELIVTATKDKVTMLDLEALEISESELELAILKAQAQIKILIGFFQDIAVQLDLSFAEHSENSNSEKASLISSQALQEDSEKITKLADEIEQSLTSVLTSSCLWIDKVKGAKNIRKELLQQDFNFKEKKNKEVINELWISGLRNYIQKIGFRLDGRQADEIRALSMQIDYLPIVHGSAVFERGNTQVLSVVTLGKISEKQLIHSVLSRSHQNFIHHYNFLPFSVNEISGSRVTVSRREIGHGELVQKTFEHIIPLNDDFPYTVRVVSEVLSSDGSSSQASICATSLALMTAGVPLPRLVAGISLGLLGETIYTDINELEDILSEIDFKIAGTTKGVCSAQLDVKNGGISLQLVVKCLQKAQQARYQLLQQMRQYIFSPRNSLAKHAMKFRKIYVGENKLGIIIGPRGKSINRLMENSGAIIEVQPNGYLLIYHLSEEQIARVYYEIKKIIE